jgi:hypothetical protein
MSEPEISSQEQVATETPVSISAVEPVATPILESEPAGPVSEKASMTNMAQTDAQIITPTITQTNIAPQQDYKSLLKRALEKIQFRKRAKLEKIVKFALENKSIANDDIEKLLRVSDKTATRYLNQLVQEGRLFRIGAPQHARYELVART